MGRKSKLNLSSLFFKPNAGGDSTSSTSSSSSSSSFSSSSWAWPSCKQQPRTDSFRSGPDTTAAATTANIYKTINSVYFDTTTDSSSDASLSFEDSDESMIRRLVRSDRLLFEPGTRTSSILEDPAPLNYSYKTFSIPATAMEMESEDPYRDFRRSMEEMVAANEKMREWESLEELLVWYLRVNGKRNHGFIVGAFVDLLVALAASKDEDGDGEGKETGACCDSMASSVCFEIEEVEEGSGSC